VFLWNLPGDQRVGFESERFEGKELKRETLEREEIKGVV
jgi:hypothetical protein